MSITQLSDHNEYDTITTGHLHGWEVTINYIENNKSYQVVPLTPRVSNMYIGDFHGLLKRLEVFPQHFHIHTRINGLTYSGEYKGENTSIKLIDQSVLTRLDAIVAPNIGAKVV